MQLIKITVGVHSERPGYERAASATGSVHSRILAGTQVRIRTAHWVYFETKEIVRDTYFIKSQVIFK